MTYDEKYGDRVRPGSTVARDLIKQYTTDACVVCGKSTYWVDTQFDGPNNHSCSEECSNARLLA